MELYRTESDDDLIYLKLSELSRLLIINIKLILLAEWRLNGSEHPKSEEKQHVLGCLFQAEF